MGKYNEKIRDDSRWITATPSPTAQALPFYAMEAGHFYGEKGYLVERQSHDSYLFLFTLAGQGRVKAGNTELLLEEGQAMVLDCRQYHRYAAVGDYWEFIWIHFNGAAADEFWRILYPNEIMGIPVNDETAFCEILSEILEGITRNDLGGVIGLSLKMHELYHRMVLFGLAGEQSGQKGEYGKYISQAVTFIESHYRENIILEDILQGIPVSKYHFIRIFSRAMGITPYSCLTACRINRSKELLRTTDLTVAEIAVGCGFTDTSNFIAQFKKRTGQRPLQYRKDFSNF